MIFCKLHRALCVQGLAFPLLHDEQYLILELTAEFVSACNGGKMLGEASVLSSFAPPLHKAKYFLFFLKH